MATTQTMANIVTKVRQRADQIGSTTFDDVTELKPWVRSSLRQLYTMFAQQDDDWYTISVPMSLSAGTEAYTMPSNMLRLASVYALYNGGANRVKLREFDQDDFGGLNYPAVTPAPMAYRLLRNLLYVQPVPTVDIFNAFEISYIPEYRHRLTDYTPIDDVMPAGADEWVVLDVLQKMAIKTRLQNMDDIIKSKQEIERRLKSAIRVRSDYAPRMRDGTPRRASPQVNFGIPQGPLYWANG